MAINIGDLTPPPVYLGLLKTVNAVTHDRAFFAKLMLSYTSSTTDDLAGREYSLSPPYRHSSNPILKLSCSVTFRPTPTDIPSPPPTAPRHPLSFRLHPSSVSLTPSSQSI